MDTSNDIHDQVNDSEEDEDDEHDVKEEPEDKDEKQSEDGEKKKRRRGIPLAKEIMAVQNMPKYKTLTKNRRAKVPRQPGATEWHLPLYADQPYPVKPQSKKKRKREDTAKYLILYLIFNFF